ncbi:MAG: FecR family protein [Ginsengibacter sp.]
MNVTRLEYLFDRYLQQSCSREEEKDLMALIAQSDNEDEIQLLINKVIENTGIKIQMSEQVAISTLQNILHKDKGLVTTVRNKPTVFKIWIRAAVAAAMVLFIAGTVYWFFDKKEDNRSAIVAPAHKQSPILPGGDRALLTMSDGTTIVLDSMQNGTLQQGNTKINKQGGLLIYKGLASSSQYSAPVVYNTLSTPRGGQFQLILPDGSKVWLNASSSLRFPTAFTGNHREVILTGEAYFEVAKNKEKPFRVKVGSMQVNVLGTHFNINAYQDENTVRTSLLEGSVRIVNGDKTDLLQPGQQEVLIKKEDKSDSYRMEKRNVDMNEVVAWRNGLFQFDGGDIKTIMRQISRWYDVEILYEGKEPERSFQGKISRDAQLNDVLKILELSNVKFSLEGKKIIVQ